MARRCGSDFSGNAWRRLSSATRLRMPSVQASEAAKRARRSRAAGLRRRSQLISARVKKVATTLPGVLAGRTSARFGLPRGWPPSPARGEGGLESLDRSRDRRLAARGDAVARLAQRRVEVQRRLVLGHRPVAVARALQGVAAGEPLSDLAD